MAVFVLRPGSLVRTFAVRLGNVAGDRQRGGQLLVDLFEYSGVFGDGKTCEAGQLRIDRLETDRRCSGTGDVGRWSDRGHDRHRRLQPSYFTVVCSHEFPDRISAIIADLSGVLVGEYPIRQSQMRQRR